MAEIRVPVILYWVILYNKFSLKINLNKIHEEEKPTANITYLLFIFSINVIKNKLKYENQR